MNYTNQEKREKTAINSAVLDLVLMTDQSIGVVAGF
jgi:hypothetical protein